MVFLAFVVRNYSSDYDYSLLFVTVLDSVFLLKTEQNRDNSLKWIDMKCEQNSRLILCVHVNDQSSRMRT